MNPWVDTKIFHSLLMELGITARAGVYDNWTDGEVHLHLSRDGHTYELRANRWQDGPEWEAARKWAKNIAKELNRL